MQSRFLTAILLSLCVAHAVLSLPLEVAPDAPAANDSERENEERINTAKDLANKNILKMEHVLNNPTEPGHQEMINAAFGTDPSLNMDQVKQTVQNLKDGPPVKIKLATDSNPSVIAYTQFEGDKTPLTPSHVSFGAKYHSSDTSDDARAATLIHEATHAQSDTGDNVVKGKILPGSDKKNSRTQMYTSQMEPYKTAAELNNDEKWAKLRDEGQTYWGDRVPATKDMHKAAEAFGQFSSMCGAAVSDAAVGLRRRAMAAGNWEEAAVYLIRRQACSLPKKKASSNNAPKDLKAKSPSAKTEKSAGDHPANKSLPPNTKSDKSASRLASAKKSKAGDLTKQRTAPVGKSTLSRSKGASPNKLDGKKSKTQLPRSKKALPKSSAKGARTGVRAKAPNSGSSKLSTRKGRLPTTKGTKGPVSKTNGKVKPSAKKNIAHPGAAKKTASRPGSTSSSKKNVPRPISKNGGKNLKKNVARPVSNKNMVRPTSKNPVSKKNVARPSNKNSGKAASKPQAQTQKKKQSMTPKVVPKPAPAANTKTVPKRNRRDLEFQL